MNIILTTNNAAANSEDQEREESESEQQVQDDDDSCSTLDSMLDDNIKEEVKVCFYSIIAFHLYSRKYQITKIKICSIFTSKIHLLSKYSNFVILSKLYSYHDRENDSPTVTKEEFEKYK